DLVTGVQTCALPIWIEAKEHAVFLSTLHRIAFRFSVASGWAMLLIGLYTMLQASRRATEKLHRTQLAALAAERRVLEGDLRAMQIGRASWRERGRSW